MGRKHLIGLALLVAVLAAPYAWLQRDEKPARVEREALFPGFASQSAGVRAIEVHRPGEPAVRVEREDGQRWRVPAKAGYPARTQAVVELLEALAGARKVQATDASPALPGLAEDGDPANQATRLNLEREGGAPLALLVGRPARQEEGQWVRVPGESRAWLIDRDIELPPTELAWLDRRVAALPLADIQRLEVRHATGERLVLSREHSGDAGFDVALLPVGRHLARADVANGLPAVFADLDFADAAPRQQATFKAPPVLTFSLRTFAGGQASGSVYAQGDQHWLVLDSRTDLTDGQWPGRSDWAYRLDDDRYQALATPLDRLLAKP